MKLFIEGRREGYSPEQCRPTMTAREMIEFLETLDPDTKLYLKNDNGYTYGSITKCGFEDGDDE